jgi:serine/threonine-protein kinase HipA
MLIVGNTDAHLKNWALRYGDGTTPELAPVYDFHSLTVYSQYHLAPLALSINGERVPSRITIDDLRRLADTVGISAQWTEDVVSEAVHSMRAAWSGELRTEAESRFPALAEHYSRRLDSLPICLVA